MTDELKIVRIRARNVPRTRTQALIGDDAILASLSPGKQRCRVLNEPGRIPLETQRSRLQTNCKCLSKEVATTVCPLHFVTKSRLIVINPVLGKKIRTSAFNKVV